MWSPAGNRIAFTKGAFTAAEVWTMNPDGSGQVQGHDELLPRRTAELAADALGLPAPGRDADSPCSPWCRRTRPARARTARTGRRSHILLQPARAMTSPYLTVGTPDANGKPTAWVSRLLVTRSEGRPRDHRGRGEREVQHRA